MSISFLEQFVRYKASHVPALVCGGVSLSYAELYRRSSALARVLRGRGIGRRSTAPEGYDIFNPGAAEYSPWVVVVSGRSVNAVIGAIAAWMAGGAFALCGADAPQSYIDAIIEDTAAAAVLRGDDFDAPETGAELSFAIPKDDEIACAVFTSGSTGKPKGAVLEHRVFNEMLRWQTEYLKPERLSNTAAYAPFGFIAAVWELFFPLANGLTLHILDDTVRHDLFALESYIEAHGISYMFLPPDIAEIFSHTYKGRALKYLRVAGGRLKACGKPEGYEILYSLGMSENGGSVTFKPIGSASSGGIPIGRAWSNTRVYLDPETGEMAVSGPSLFRGYLSRGEETRKKLIKNPYSDEPGYEMMYLSGDLARLDENGELHHMGRNDWTVKIRDMKVNPMQVEAVLGGCEGVADCCVTAQTLGGESILAAWITGSADTGAVKSDLAARLPEYMIPSVFVTLDRLPRNTNGKIDRDKLIYIPPGQSAPDTADAGALSAAAVISALFERVLGRAAGQDDSFLALGGDSLKLMRLQAEIARELSVSIPYTALMKNPTPREISELLDSQPGFTQIPAAPPMDAYPLSEPMRQMWLLRRTGQDGGKYTVSVRCRFKGEIDKTRVIGALRELTRLHSILRSRFIERGGEVFQIVEDAVDFTLTPCPRREFNLSDAPLFDVTLTENELILTTHHIIADAAGLRVLIEDFWTLYGGGKPSQAAQAHDVTMWELGRDLSADEEYWRGLFDGFSPPPPLPCDFPRPPGLKTAEIETAFFDKAETEKLREYAVSRGATLFQLFLAAYALLLSKLYAGGGVTIGVPFSGREHPGTRRTAGMLVKTLPLRLDVSGASLHNALEHTRARFAGAWEHQGVSLAGLTELIDRSRTVSGNAFYDVMINYVPLPLPLTDDSGLAPEVLRGEYSGALFDLVLDVREEADGFSAVFTYANELFLPETVRRWAGAYKKLLLTGEAEIDAACAVASVPGGNTSALDMSLPQVPALLESWKDVLGTDIPLPEDNFFAAGGTSLAAIRLEADLFSKGWLLSAADILQNPRLARMAPLMVPADEIDWEEDV